MAIQKPNARAAGPGESHAPDLWRGLALCVPALDGAMYDYAGRVMGTATTGTAAPAVVGTRYGRGVSYAANLAGHSFPDSPTVRLPSTAVTVAFAFIRTAGNGFTRGIGFGKDVGSDDFGSYSISFDDSGDGEPQFSISNGDFSPQTTGPVTITTGTPHLAVGRWATGSALELRVYNLVTGALVGTASTAGTVSGSIFYDTATFKLALRGTADQKLTHLAGYVWSRRLSDAEVAGLVHDPWSLVRARSTPSVDAPAAGGSATVEPGAASLSLGTFAPTVAVSDHKTATPGLATLTLTAQSPTLFVTDPKVAAPGVASVTLTGQAPAVEVTANQTVAPGAASLALTAQTPTVAATANQAVTPGVASLSLAAQTPDAQSSSATAVTPGAASLTLAQQAPAVAATQNQVVSPGPASLTLTALPMRIAEQVVGYIQSFVRRLRRRYR